LTHGPRGFWKRAAARAAATKAGAALHPDIDEVDAHVRHVMQRTLDRLAEERRLPMLG
jgi:hypothetical protein